MSLFESLGQNQPVNQQQLLQQLRSNPAEMLKQKGLNVPAGMNNPQQIVNHLVQSGQIPQNRLTQLLQMIRR